MPKATPKTARVGVMSRVLNGAGAIRAAMAAFKDFGVTADGDRGWFPIGGHRWGQRYAGSNRDWEKDAGTLWHNSATAICLGFLFNKMAEPRPQVVTLAADGTANEVPSHPLIDLLRKPNPEYNGKAMLAAAALSYQLTGDGYLVKARGMGGHGPVKELWYIPHWQMEPVAPESGGPTELYVRQIGNHKWYYAKSDVIHFKFSINPENPRKGWSNYRAQFRGVVSDNEIDTYTATVLGSIGLGVLVSPANKEDEILPEDGDVLKDLIRESITKDQRGEVIVPSKGIKVDRIGYSPQEVAIKDMGERPEARILASFGFNAMAVGLPSDDKKYANLKESRSAAWEDGIVPMMTVFAETFTEEMLAEMGSDGEVFQWDYSKVRDLMPDLDAAAKRSVAVYTGGVATLNESRAYLHLPKVDDGDKFIPVPVAPKDSGGKDT